MPGKERRTQQVNPRFELPNGRPMQLISPEDIQQEESKTSNMWSDLMSAMIEDSKANGPYFVAAGSDRRIGDSTYDLNHQDERALLLFAKIDGSFITITRKGSYRIAPNSPREVQLIEGIIDTYLRNRKTNFGRGLARNINTPSKTEIEFGSDAMDRVIYDISDISSLELMSLPECTEELKKAIAESKDIASKKLLDIRKPEIDIFIGEKTKQEEIGLLIKFVNILKDPNQT